jgi:hypothetical protein
VPSALLLGLPHLLAMLLLLLMMMMMVGLAPDCLCLMYGL